METNRNKKVQENRSMKELKMMSDEELVTNYRAIRDRLKLIDVYYLTEITKRNLLSELNN